MPKEEEEAHTHLARKSTLVKTRVGCVRTSTYDLPQNPNHTYGSKSTVNEDEKVGNIITSWVTSNPSAGKESSKLIVFSNILAIKNGCVTSRAMRKYAAEHPNIRRKEALASSSARVDSRFEGPFGRATFSADEGMDQIIQAKYTNFGHSDIDYPDVSSIKKTGSFPKPRATNASQSVATARQNREAKKETKKFCMKRFQNIKGTFTLPNQTVRGIPAKPEHADILVRHHHDLDAEGNFHGEDRHREYSHDAPSNQRFE